MAAEENEAKGEKEETLECKNETNGPKPKPPWANTKYNPQIEPTSYPNNIIHFFTQSKPEHKQRLALPKFTSISSLFTQYESKPNNPQPEPKVKPKPPWIQHQRFDTQQPNPKPPWTRYLHTRPNLIPNPKAETLSEYNEASHQAAVAVKDNRKLCQNYSMWRPLDRINEAGGRDNAKGVSQGEEKMKEDEEEEHVMAEEECFGWMNQAQIYVLPKVSFTHMAQRKILENSSKAKLWALSRFLKPNSNSTQNNQLKHINSVTIRPIPKPPWPNPYFKNPRNQIQPSIPSCNLKEPKNPNPKSILLLNPIKPQSSPSTQQVGFIGKTKPNPILTVQKPIFLILEEEMSLQLLYKKLSGSCWHSILGHWGQKEIVEIREKSSLFYANTVLKANHAN